MKGSMKTTAERRSTERCVSYYLRLCQAIGLIGAINLTVRRKLGFSRPVSISCGRHSLTVRPTDSDTGVLAQIFGFHEYETQAFRTDHLNDLAAHWKRDGATPLIVDAGANVGYSTLYFADQFPDATVIAVEPDDECVALIRRHCAGNPRIIIVHAALWSHENGVRIDNQEADSWARRVSEGGITPSLTLRSLLGMVPNARPLLLKLDIEGAEAEVCQASPEQVARFPCIMIEPHDWMLPGTACLDALYRAVAGRKMDTLVVGETLALFDSEIVLDKASR
jgi:FkbM family methyltransferase